MKPIKKEIVWDKKKIFILVIFLVVFLILGVGLLNLNEKPKDYQNNIPSGRVKGLDTSDLPNIKQGVQEGFDSLQKEVQNLNIEEIATSSPQMQKIINDLRSLKDVPKSQLKNTCERICSGL